ncbi:MAG TPA: helix-turn-helix transcriptional regulator [Steroidobacteraceae bacterium]|nr:helix-turn-helix transcriptional regulator [Steroidobacteraceae bacterium]
MTDLKRLHKRWSRKPSYRRAYDALREEFIIAQAMIGARQRAGLTQTELARRIKTTQSVIARLESGRALPSGRTLQRFARATGSRLAVRFEPIASR